MTVSDELMVDSLKWMLTMLGIGCWVVGVDGLFGQQVLILFVTLGFSLVCRRERGWWSREAERDARPVCGGEVCPCMAGSGWLWRCLEEGWILDSS